MEVTCLINLLSLVIKHSGCELDEDDARYSLEDFAGLVEVIFMEINQLHKWEEDVTFDKEAEHDDEVLTFHKGH